MEGYHSAMNALKEVSCPFHHKLTASIQLLLEDNLAIVLALCDVMNLTETTSDPDEVAVALVHFFEAQHKSVHLLEQLISKEVALTRKSTSRLFSWANVSLQLTPPRSSEEIA